MALVLRTPPAAEPVTLVDAKQHLRVTDADEDALIGQLIAAARRRVELAAGLALITQGWSLYLDCWPEGPETRLPLWPVSAIEDVFIYGEDDIGAAIDGAHYFVDTVSRPARLVRRTGREFPVPGRAANGIEVAFSAGYGATAAAVPAELRQALLMLIAHFYEHRGDAALPTGLPLTFEAAIAPYRAVRL